MGGNGARRQMANSGSCKGCGCRHLGSCVQAQTRWGYWFGDRRKSGCSQQWAQKVGVTKQNALMGTAGCLRESSRKALGNSKDYSKEGHKPSPDWQLLLISHQCCNLRKAALKKDAM